MTKKSQSLADAMAQAKLLQPRLAAATDTLNGKISEFEKALATLKLGVVARVRYWCDDDGGGQDLQFSKWGDGWRLVVVSWGGSDPEDERFELLQNASREARLEAVELFPDLVSALSKAAVLEIDRVSEATKSIDELINSMKSGQER
jgi:hypothetical protein